MRGPDDSLSSDKRDRVEEHTGVETASAVARAEPALAMSASATEKGRRGGSAYLAVMQSPPVTGCKIWYILLQEGSN